MGVVWAMMALVIVSGLLFFRAMVGHQWGLFAVMAVCLTIVSIWGTKGSIPRRDSSRDSHY